MADSNERYIVIYGYGKDGLTRLNNEINDYASQGYALTQHGPIGMHAESNYEAPRMYVIMTKVNR